jgi:hypothetical protein
MPKEKSGLIRFGLMFNDQFCILRRFRSRLRAMKLFGFGFQADKSKIYDFDGLTSSIREMRFKYGSKLGLFVQNNQTREQEEFNFEIPPKNPDAQVDKAIYCDQYEMDITEILDRISKQSDEQK